MKIILDIKDERHSSFMELLQSLDYVQVLKEVNDDDQGQAIQDLVEAFDDVKQYEKGKKNLTSGKDLLDEL